VVVQIYLAWTMILWTARVFLESPSARGRVHEPKSEAKRARTLCLSILSEAT
jgi:hypothetical protein